MPCTGCRGRFFWNLPVLLTKCVNKISRPNVVDKFGVFFDKTWNIEFDQPPRNQTVTSDDGF